MTTNRELNRIRTKHSALDGLPMADIQKGMEAIEAKRQAEGIQIAPEHGLIPRLIITRRLSMATVQAFDIQPYKFADQWGYKYAIPTGGDRWKNSDSDKNPKYAWPAGKPTDAVFYYRALDLLPAIAEAGGLVWLTTEADVWTLREAGIKNALSTFGETIIPNELGDMLLSMGVFRVQIAPDLDPTGTGWAQRIKGALWGSGIDLTCYQLPAELGEGGDIGKAWQAYRRPEPFLFWLQSLPQIAVKEPVPMHTTIAPAYFPYSTTQQDPLAQIKQAITARLGVETFAEDGYSLENIPCVFHNDQDPSAGLHVDKGLHCFVCGWHTWKELAQELGIAWPWAHTVTISAVPVGIVGMSREARSILISAGLTNLARALDILIDNHRGGDILTLAEFTACVGPMIGDSTARLAFDNLRGLRLPKTLTKIGEGSIRANLTLLNTLQHTEGTNSRGNSPHRSTGKPMGKPQARAKVPTEADINAALDIKPANRYGLTYYPMAPNVIGNAKRYRAEVLRDVIRRKPGKYARKQIKNLAGIRSNSTIKVYCDETGTVRTPQPPRLIELTPAQLLELPTNHRERVKLIKQKKLNPVPCLQDERGIKHEYTQAGAQRADDLGEGKLYRVEYQASDYRLKDQAEKVSTQTGDQ